MENTQRPIDMAIEQWKADLKNGVPHYMIQSYAVRHLAALEALDDTVDARDESIVAVKKFVETLEASQPKG